MTEDCRPVSAPSTVMKKAGERDVGPVADGHQLTDATSCSIDEVCQDSRRDVIKIESGEGFDQWVTTPASCQAEVSSDVDLLITKCKAEEDEVEVLLPVCRYEEEEAIATADPLLLIGCIKVEKDDGEIATTVTPTSKGVEEEAATADPLLLRCIKVEKDNDEIATTVTPTRKGEDEEEVLLPVCRFKEEVEVTDADPLLLPDFIKEEDLKVISSSGSEQVIMQEPTEDTSPELFPCKMCEKRYTSEDVLSRHLMSHCVIRLQRLCIQDSTLRYTCATCEEHYALRDLLTHHEQLHFGPASAEQDVRSELSTKAVIFEPDIVFNNVDTLDNSSVLSDTMCSDKCETQSIIDRCFVCDECGKEFRKKEKLRKHLSPHVSDCDLLCRCDVIPCTSRFKTNVQLRLHKQTPFACNIATCTKRFKSKWNLKKHRKTHSDLRPSACNLSATTQCSKSKVDLSTHKESHSDVRSFSCDVAGCSKRFTTNRYLIIHKARHSGVRPFACNVVACLKRYVTKGELANHTAWHSKDRPFVCKVSTCTKGFKSKGELSCHETTHSDSRPFACKIGTCTVRFKFKKLLKNHEATHFDVRPFACKFRTCTKLFKTKSELTHHTVTHSDLRPFACGVGACSKHFKSKGVLAKHIASHPEFKPLTCNVGK